MGSTDVRNSYQSTQLEEVYCAVVVRRPLPGCEHSVSMACSADPSQIRCTNACDVERPCCSKRCPAQCWECKKPPMTLEFEFALQFGFQFDWETPPGVDHVRHACGKVLFCQHICEEFCAIGHVCGECTSECRQSCVHHSCELGCSIACTPCAEPCPWSCPHQMCPVPCGSVSSSTTISVPRSVINFWADMHSTPVRFTLLKSPQMRSLVYIPLRRTMRRSTLCRVCIRGRNGG